MAMAALNTRLPWWQRARRALHTLGQRRLPARWVLGLTGALALLALGIASTQGAYALSTQELLQVLQGALTGAAPTGSGHLVFMHIRLPRLLLGAAAGAGLALAGALMQGLFRNPLADPGLVGVSSGAALAAATAIVLGGLWWPSLPRSLGSWPLLGMAFAGGAGGHARHLPAGPVGHGHAGGAHAGGGCGGECAGHGGAGVLECCLDR